MEIHAQVSEPMPTCFLSSKSSNFKSFKLSLTERIVSLVSMFAAYFRTNLLISLYKRPVVFSVDFEKIRLKLSMCGRIKERK